jgi:hypothetical protein
MNCLLLNKRPVPEAVASKIKNFDKITEGLEACMAYDSTMEYWLLWQGGHDVFVYNAKGTVILTQKVGDRRVENADTKQVHQWMKDRINNCDYIYF